jgi:6-pyruvoyltetrahydropterin/6-carboxytetrahydropterin synthase
VGPLQRAGPGQGMVLDFDELASLVEKTVIEPLDHSSLNELLPNPTAELIAQWIWERLSPRLEGLDEVTLWETATACATVRADDARAG